MGILSRDFENLLTQRIDAIRKTVHIDPEKQLTGYNFHYDDGVKSTVVAAVMVDANEGKTVPKEDLQEFSRVHFRPEYVTAGRFDKIIDYVLKQMAYMDFSNSHRLDLH